MSDRTLRNVFTRERDYRFVSRMISDIVSIISIVEGVEGTSFSIHVNYYSEVTIAIKMIRVYVYWNGYQSFECLFCSKDSVSYKNLHEFIKRHWHAG